jgi:hypothetical protein
MLIAIAVVVIVGATSTAAQERELLVPRPQSEMTIGELSVEVYNEVKSLQAFEAMPARFTRASTNARNSARRKDH